MRPGAPSRRVASGVKQWREQPNYRPAFRVLPYETAHNARNFKENIMGLGTILLVILILMLIGAIPSWPHSKNWGYGPSGGLGLVVIILVVLLVTGRL